ncbi:MAG TPA: sigma-70 family RNA polymerase sigma factor [Pyrinomonadaceae bacterium]|jgi:RNA polymerase sigma factor (TIGR02999 family)|nr:sigma-70 family RNA polymerase sigma factor [Pyrinomonadaceae bacterium]
MKDETVKPVTQLLLEIKNGRRDSLDELLPLVYGELRRLADNYLRRERTDHTLQPTALVHEAYLKLIGQKEVDWQNRAHFFGVAARLMREILIDHARTRNREKRGGKFQTRVVLDEAISFFDEKDLDILALDEALTNLEKLDPEQTRIVELRFFGGLTVEETAEALGISPATVKREWQTAKLWLLRELAVN